MVKKTKTAPWVKTETPAGVARRLGFDDRVNARDAMARVLAAGEALREAASAYDAALSAIPHGVVGYALGVEVDEITDVDDSDALVDRARERAREHLKRLNTVAARKIDEVLERLTGVVSMKVTPQLALLERAIYDAHQADAKGTRP